MSSVVPRGRFVCHCLSAVSPAAPAALAVLPLHLFFGLQLPWTPENAGRVLMLHESSLSKRTFHRETIGRLDAMSCQDLVHVRRKKNVTLSLLQCQISKGTQHSAIICASRSLGLAAKATADPQRCYKKVQSDSPASTRLHRHMSFPQNRHREQLYSAIHLPTYLISSTQASIFCRYQITFSAHLAHSAPSTTR